MGMAALWLLDHKNVYLNLPPASLPNFSTSYTTMADKSNVTGGCECGRVRYSAPRDSSSLKSTLCYCKQCQRHGGAPFIAFLDLKRESTRWTTAPDTFASSDFAARDFCKVCGSTIGMRYHFQEKSLGVTLGSVDKDCDIVPEITCHIFLKDCPAWYQLPDDGKPRYQEFDDDGRYQDGIKRWRAAQKQQ